MRILHVIGFDSGIKKYRQHIYVEELSKSINVQLLSSNLDFETKTQNKIEDSHIYKRVPPIFNYKGAVLFRFINNIKEFNPDLVHLYEVNQFITFFVAIYCLWNKIPYVYEHEQRSIGSAWYSKLYFYIVTLWFLKVICNYASLIRVVTPGAKFFLNKYTKKNIYTSNLFYDENAYFDEQYRVNFITNNNLTNKKIFITTGVFTKYKKLNILIDVFSKLDSSYLLIILGDIKNNIDIYSDNIMIFEGLRSRDELNRFYSISDYAIFTSLTISYFEALGAGCKILIPYSSGNSHLKSDNIIFYGDSRSINFETGYIEDDELITVEIFNKVKYLACEKNNIRNVDANFSVTKVCEILIRQYEKILKQ